MRILIPLLVGALLCLGCSEYRKQTETVAYKKLVEDELASGIRHDTIILDYVLGMTKSEYSTHTNNLLLDSTLVQLENGAIVHQITISPSIYTSEKAQVLLRAWFNNDSLYKVIAHVTPLPEEAGHTSSGSLLIVDLNEMLSYRYGPPDLDREIEHNGSKALEMMWIDGNRFIRLGPKDDFATIEYTDLPIKRRLDEQKKLELKRGQKKLEEDYEKSSNSL